MVFVMNILMMPNEKILATIGIQPVLANKDLMEDISKLSSE